LVGESRRAREEAARQLGLPWAVLPPGLLPVCEGTGGAIAVFSGAASEVFSLMRRFFP